MKRLTIPDVRVDENTTRRTMIDVEAVQEHAMDFYWRLKAYEDTGLTPEEAKRMSNILMDVGIDYNCSWEYVKNWLLDARLCEIAEADKDGRLVVLPCKVGDTLFRVFAGEILEHKVGNMRYLAIQGRWDIDTYPFCAYVESSIGKTIFLTREEAEKALEAMKDG